jgi:pimeloyl-ACP methyl ester carboxylesterase
MDDDIRAVGGLLGYASAGDPDAPTVVLLHGVGTTSWMWRRGSMTSLASFTS